METEVIDVQTFIRNLRRNLDDPVPEGLVGETRIQDLPNWSSLQALLVVASFERDYGVSLPAEEFRRAETLEDLHGIVLQRMGR